MANCLIEFDFNLKHLILLLNTIFNFFLYDGEKNIYSYYSGNILCCIISIILYLKLNKDEKLEKERVTFFSLEKKKENDGPRKSKMKTLIDFFIVFLIFTIYNGSIFVIHYLGKRMLFAFRNFSLIPMILFYHFIMKEKIYLHHFICLILIFIFTRFHPYFKPRIIYGEKLSSIIFYCLFGIQQYSLKYMMAKNYVNPFIISFFDSLSQIILDIIKLYVGKRKTGKNFFDDSYYKITSKWESIKYIIGTIISVIINAVILFYLTPFHFFISQEIGVLNDFDLESIIYTICIIFSLLIFVEIIILNFCGLSTNTRKKIMERAKKDSINNLITSYRDEIKL